MATPDQINQLTYDDQQSYQFILESQGVEQADFFLNRKLEDYAVQHLNNKNKQDKVYKTIWTEVYQVVCFQVST